MEMSKSQSKIARERAPSIGKRQDIQEGGGNQQPERKTAAAEVSQEMAFDNNHRESRNAALEVRRGSGISQGQARVQS